MVTIVITVVFYIPPSMSLGWQHACPALLHIKTDLLTKV